MTRLRLFAIASLAVLVTACASSRPGDAATVDGPLMGLEGGQQEAVWSGWTPSGRMRSTPSGLANELRAFDYLRVTDRAAVEKVWAGVFPVVDAVRSRMSDTQRKRTASVLLEALESARSAGEAGAEGPPVHLDMTYVVSNDANRPFEGLASRMWCELGDGATPVVTVLMLRSPDDGDRPGRIVVWASPGFEEAARWTAEFRRRGDQWSHRLYDGLTLAEEVESADGEEADGEEGGQAREMDNVAARVLRTSIWRAFSGREYLEVRDDGAAAEAAAGGVDRALGLEVGDRGIDQVYSGTHFPPRVDAGSL